MIKAHCITIEAKSREARERMLGEEFNKWTTENLKCEIYHIFEPIRWEKTYGDYTYNTYHISLTFFYKELMIEIKD